MSVIKARLALGEPWFQVSLGLFVIGWGANQFVSLVVAYRLDAGLSTATAEQLVGIYALGLIPTLLLVGPYSDRTGRSRLLNVALLISALASVTMMIGHNTESLLYLGRFLAGIASGFAFAVGTSWVKELSIPPWDTKASTRAGARRAAVALSLGFGLGPVIAGVVAQWIPNPLVASYLPHLVVLLLVWPFLLKAPETIDEDKILRESNRISKATRRVFCLRVAPVAPWVFVAPTVSFAVLPDLVINRSGSFPIAFAALTSGITLGVGVLIQPALSRYRSNDTMSSPSVSMLPVILGLLIAALAVEKQNPVLVLTAAVFLGAGYGLCVTSLLHEVHRLASASELATLSSWFFALAYTGFAAPVILSLLSRFVGYAELITALAGLALVTAFLATATARSLNLNLSGASSH